MTHATVIAIDLGHSAVKSIALSKTHGVIKLLIPSMVCQAFSISDDKERGLAEIETVTVNNRQYFFGETAKTQCGASVSIGLNEDWIESPEHTALLLGTLQKLASNGVDIKRPNLVLGLPTHLYARQRDRLEKIVRSHIECSDLKIIPQSMGPYYELMLSENGMPADDHSVDSESWGVVEIGYFTTDFGLIENGRWKEKASGICSGARVAAEHLIRLLSEQNMTIDLIEAEEALRTGYIRNFGKRMDVAAEVKASSSIIVAEVIDTAARLMEPYARRLDGVLVAGGGAPIAFDLIADRWPHAVLANDSRFSVVEGMRRIGLARAMTRSMPA